MITENMDGIISELVTMGNGAFELYLEHYMSYPSAKDLKGEKYSNFMEFKIRSSYNKVKEKYPRLRNLEEVLER